VRKNKLKALFVKLFTFILKTD